MTDTETRKLDSFGTDDDRPDDCHCSGEPFETVPCFPCYREGHEEPNPDAEPEDDTDD